MDFKRIGFLIKWILNGLDQSKTESDQEKLIFCPSLYRILSLKLSMHVKRFCFLKSNIHIGINFST